ncbi:antiterminator Q family protein [Pasteurellaceae bacterium 22721_9_1]
MQHIDRVLIAWGRFANSRIGTEYPYIAAGMRMAIEHDCSHHIFSLTDDTCILIGEQILRLREKSDLRYEIIMAKYAYRLPDEDIWRVLNMSKTSYFKELAKAKSYVEGAIEGAEIMAYFYA